MRFSTEGTVVKYLLQSRKGKETEIMENGDRADCKGVTRQNAEAGREGEILEILETALPLN